MTVIPAAAIVSGRCWPFLMVLPIVAAPIIAKSLREFTYSTPQHIPTGTGWLLIVAIPAAVLCYAAVELIQRSDQKQSTRTFSAISLLLSIATFFGLNTVFFDSAWPCNTWTSRTPNHLIFTICALALTSLSLATLCSRRPLDIQAKSE